MINSDCVLFPNLMFPQKGGADIEAEAMRDKILNAGDNLNGRIRYYISPNGDDANDGKSPEKPIKTIMQIRMLPLRSGDAVLFERGGVWRANDSIYVRGGVRYGAYGVGSKPAIYGSEKNYAQSELWRPCNEKNIWKLDLPREEAGMIIFNHGESIGVRKPSFEDVRINGDYFHDVESDSLYICYDKGNPADFCDDIEIATTQSIFFAQNVNYVTIDNLCLKYASIFAVDCGNNKEITITNCEMGWIGGHMINAQNIKGYGNAVQFWYRCDNVRVENCWIYQVYDAALTFQGIGGPEESQFKGIVFKENLIEYSSMNFEYWAESVKDTRGLIHDVSFTGNILRFAGYGWSGQQRPDSGAQAFLLGWGKCYENMKNFIIQDNIFDCADCNIIWAASPAQQEGLVVQGNSYYQKKTTGRHSYTEVVRGGGKHAASQAELETAVKEFEPNPKLIRWLD